jgi:regulator of protease activity HflC (stomatin/prohibitin superfamily)
MFDRFSGVKQAATGEGTHFLIPWLQRAILYDVRIKPRVSRSMSGDSGADQLEHLNHHGIQGHANGLVDTSCHV